MSSEIILNSGLTACSAFTWNSERIAGVDVKAKESKVEFDLLPPLKKEGMIEA